MALRMEFDGEAGASYIRLARREIADTYPLENPLTRFGIVVDVDASGLPIGVEFLGREGSGPESFLAAIADESVANSLAAEGFEVPQLRGNPEVRVETYPPTGEPDDGIGRETVPVSRPRQPRHFSIWPYVGERKYQLMGIALGVICGLLWLPDWWWSLAVFVVVAVLVGYEVRYIRHGSADELS